MKTKKVLFLGLEGCDYSQKAIDYLVSMGCDINVVLMKDRTHSLTEDTKAWSGDLILSFKNYIKLPLSLIKSAHQASVNFHPATPNYPGSGGLAWSLYHEDPYMGITVHLMNEKIDNGKILKVYKKKVEYPTTLEKMTPILSQFHLKVFKKFLREFIFNGSDQLDLTCSDRNLGGWEWGKTVLKLSDLEKMKVLTSEIDKEEIKRRIRAFHLDKYPIKFLHEEHVSILQSEKNVGVKAS